MLFSTVSLHFSDIQAFNLILLGILYLTVRILSGLSQYIQLTVVLGLLFYFLGEAIAGFGQIHDFVAPPPSYSSDERQFPKF